jgi:hypothetical protein
MGERPAFDPKSLADQVEICLQIFEPADEVHQEMPLLVDKKVVLGNGVKIKIGPAGFGPVFEKIGLEIKLQGITPPLVLRHDTAPGISDECKFEVLLELRFRYVPTRDILRCGQVGEKVGTTTWIIVERQHQLGGKIVGYAQMPLDESLDAASRGLWNMNEHAFTVMGYHGGLQLGYRDMLAIDSLSRRANSEPHCGAVPRD